MKIKMIVSAAGPAGVFDSGQEYDVDKEIARSFIKGGLAVAIEKPVVKKETATSKVKKEKR